MSTQDPEVSGGAAPGAADEGSSGKPLSPRRRALLVAVAVVVVTALVALGVGLAGGDEGRSASLGTESSTAVEASDAGASATDAAATQGQSEPTESDGPEQSTEDLPPALPDVPLDASVAVDDGLVAMLPLIEAFEGVGQGPGNVSGPALRVTVRIENGTQQPVSLDGVTVNMFYGSASTPASPLEDASRQPFVGELPSGEAAEGVYVFSVPSDARDSVTVELGHRAGAPRAIFSGPVA